ncbi:hypothetical protein EXN66_Car004879 [Channa argus]|uniref:Parathyroid hormone n=1 Tax=Channa argus TaxID=215402 RepID=A0A6G1PG37_CHAAH|nr:hypothetical protein EXN66_Car004879 [Channa argus]
MEYKQVQERREWLQMRLRGIHTAPAGSDKDQTDSEELPNLTPDDIQYALIFLEKLLDSNES